MIKLLAITAFSFGLATGAIAQTSAPTVPSDAPSASINLPSGWAGPISEAFFTDEKGTMLRTDEEIQARWSSLSGEQQAQIRADCKTLATNEPKADGETPDASVDTNVNSINHICTLVEAM